MEIKVQGSMLKAVIISKNMTMKQFAEKLGISRATLWRKTKNPNIFTRAEIKAAANILSLDGADVMDIFFNEKVS